MLKKVHEIWIKLKYLLEGRYKFCHIRSSDITLPGQKFMQALIFWFKTQAIDQRGEKRHLNKDHIQSIVTQGQSSSQSYR